MNKIIRETMAKYVEGKTDFVIYEDNFESNSIDEAIATFDVFKNIKIKPEKDYLKFAGELIDFDFSDKEKAELEQIWTKATLKYELQKQKMDVFYEENKDKIQELFYDFLDDDEDNDESNEVEKPLKKKFEIITRRIKSMFSNISVYDDGKKLTFWHIGKSIELDIVQITRILNILKFIKGGGYGFYIDIMPMFDFLDDENKNATGVSFILSIDY